MGIEDLSPFWREHFGRMWTKQAQRAWGSIENYLDTLDESRFNFLAAQEGNEAFNENIKANSPFAISYARWKRRRYDRNTKSYAQMLAHAGFFDTESEALTYYGLQ